MMLGMQIVPSLLLTVGQKFLAIQNLANTRALEIQMDRLLI